jgi:chromosome segregation ATPase
LQVLHSKLAARGDGLEKCWSELKGQCEQLKEAISRTAERASEGRSAISVAQQQLDAVRQSWERDERAALSKAQLPTADKSYCDVLYDIAEQLRVVNEQSVDLRRARSEHGISVTTLEDDLEEQHTAFIKTIFSLLSKYDEVAAALATVESKRRQLDAEAEDQRLAKLTLDTEWKDIAHHADRLRTVSSTIQKEAALVAANPPPLQSAADNRYAYGYHVPASRSLVTQQQQQQYYTTRMFSEPSMAPSGRRQESTWADFSTLLRVPDDTSVGSASHRTGPRSQSITTPSPDTES